MGPRRAPAGPCHHYTFELCALDTKLDVPMGTPQQAAATRTAVMDAMDGHDVLAKAVLVASTAPVSLRRRRPECLLGMPSHSPLRLPVPTPARLVSSLHDFIVRRMLLTEDDVDTMRPISPRRVFQPTKGTAMRATHHALVRRFVSVALLLIWMTLPTSGQGRHSPRKAGNSQPTAAT